MDTVVLTSPEQIQLVRLSTVIRALETHIKFKGKFRLTRMATPTTMRQIASEFTGKTYARSMKGLETALADLAALKESIVQ